MLKSLKRWYQLWVFLFYFNCFAAGLNFGTFLGTKHMVNIVYTAVSSCSAWFAFKYMKEAKVAYKIALLENYWKNKNISV